MFQQSVIRLWLHTVVVTTILLFLLVRFGPFGLYHRPDPFLYTPAPSLLSPTLDLALGFAISGGMAAFLGFFLILNFLRYLLRRAATRAGHPAPARRFGLSLLLHSQLLALGLSAALLLLPPLLALLGQLWKGTPNLPELAEILRMSGAMSGLLLLALAPASLLAWLYNAPRLRAEWNAALAR